MAAPPKKTGNTPADVIGRLVPGVAPKVPATKKPAKKKTPSSTAPMLRPNYGLVFDPTGQQSEILAGEKDALRDLYLMRATEQAGERGRALEDHDDPRVALEQAGLLKPTVSKKSVKDLKRGGSDEFASAMDALDYLDRAAGKAIGKAPIAWAAGVSPLGLAGKAISDRVDIPEDKIGLGWAAGITPLGVVAKLGANAAGVDVTDAIGDLPSPVRNLRVDREGIKLVRPDSSRTVSNDLKALGRGAAKVASAGLLKASDAAGEFVSGLPSPIMAPEFGSTFLRPSQTGGTFIGPGQPKTLGDVQAQFEDMAANSNKYVDAGAVDRTPVPGLDDAGLQIVDVVANGGTQSDVDGMIRSLGMSGLSQISEQAMRTRAEQNGWDDKQWRDLTVSEKFYRSGTKNEFVPTILRSFVRGVGMAGATPAGVKAIVDATAKSMGGDTAGAEQVIKAAFGPYAAFRSQSERMGVIEAAVQFIAQNPQEAFMLGNIAARLGSRAAGATMRAGLSPVPVKAWRDRAAAYAEKGQRVAAPGATIKRVVVPKPDLVPEPLVDPVRPVASYVERLAAQRENQRRLVDYEAQRKRVPEPVDIEIGYTGSGILGTLMMKVVQKRIAENSAWYRNRLDYKRGKRGGRFSGNIKQGVEAEIQTILLRALGVVPDDMTRQRYAFSLVWPSEGFGRQSITPKVIADYFRTQIVKLEEKIAESERKALDAQAKQKASGEVPTILPDMDREALQGQIQLWRDQAQFFDALDRVEVNPEVVARLRQAAKPLGKENDEIIAAITGQTEKEIKRQNYIRLAVIDPDFEKQARGLWKQRNAARFEFSAAQREAARVARRIQLRMTDRGYRKFDKEGNEKGVYSAADSLRRYTQDRAALISALDVAEKRARELGLDDLAEQYGAARRTVDESGFDAASRRNVMEMVDRELERLALSRDRVDEVLPEPARAPYLAALDAKERAAAQAAVVGEARSAYESALEDVTTKRGKQAATVDDRMLGLADQDVEAARANLASLESFPNPDAAAVAKAQERVAVAEARAASVRRAVDAKREFDTQSGMLSQIETERAAALRQAKAVLRENTPVLDSDGVVAAVDAANRIAAVEVKKPGKISYFTIGQARGEALDEFIARVEANDRGAVLHLVQKQDFERLAEVVRVTGHNMVDTGPLAKINKGRVLPSRGYTFAMGLEASTKMWQQLLVDAAELKSAQAWKDHIEKTVDASSIVVHFNDGQLQIARKRAEALLNDGVEETEDAAMQSALKEQINALGIEYDGNITVLNLRSPYAKKPPKRVSLGVSRAVGDEESIARIMEQSINARVVDPNAPGDYYLMPTAFYRGLQDAIKNEAFRFEPGSKMARADEIVRAWRNVQLNLLPRTAFANITGSVILALQAGAGPRSFYFAAKALLGKKQRLADGSMVDLPIPPELRQRYYDQVTSNVGSGRIRRGGLKLGRDAARPGEAVLAAEYGLAGIAWWMNNMRRLNGMSEDLGRLAVWYSKAYPAAAKEAGASRFFYNARELNAKAHEYIELMAKGDPSWEVAHQQWMRQSFDFLGDLHRGGEGVAKVRIAIPFWQWYTHILKLTLWTMPVKYPGRALFLSMLADIGEEYQQQHGIVVPWGATYVPFLEDSVDMRGQKQWIIKSIDMGNIYPEASNAPLYVSDAGGLGLGGVEFLQKSVTPGITNAALIAASIGSVAAGGDALRLDEKNWVTAARDEFGNPINDVFSSQMAAYIANQMYLSFPLAPVVLETSGRAATSFPGHVREKPQNPETLRLNREHYDLWSRISDPLANLPSFVLKLTTGVRLFTETPGPGPIYQQRNRRIYEQIARERNAEDDRVRRALSWLHLQNVRVERETDLG